MEPGALVKLHRLYHEAIANARRDPYRYGPIMGETDLYLFAEGQHWRIYDKFGAHLPDMRL